MFFKLLGLIIFFLTLIFFKLYAEEGVPDFPYDPEEKASEIKMCARICLRRKEVCFQREAGSEEIEQMCQSQFILCINQCK